MNIPTIMRTTIKRQKQENDKEASKRKRTMNKLTKKRMKIRQQQENDKESKRKRTMS